MTEASELNARIVAGWEAHESADPNISTEYLAYLVEKETGANYQRQIDALGAGGFFRKRIAELWGEDTEDDA